MGIDHFTAGAVPDLFQQVGGIPGAAVDQGGDIVGQLDGRDLGTLLADGHRQDIALIPGAPHGLRIVRAGQDARLLIQFQAGLLAQAKSTGIVPQAVNAQLAAYVVDGLAHGLISVGAAILAVDPAQGAVLGVIGIPSLVLDLGIGRNNAFLQSGNAGDHLEGRTRGVQALERPVEQGPQGVGQVFVIVGVVLGQVEGGVGCAGLDARIIYVQNDTGGALYLFTLQLGQVLQVLVDGKHHVAPGLRLGDPLGVYHLALSVALDGALAGGAPQPRLEGGLHPEFAHGVVHVIPQVFVSAPFLPVNGTHLSHKMGGYLSIILSDAHRVNTHSGQSVLLHLSNKADVHILGKDILLPIDVPAAEIDLIQHAGQGPGIRRSQIADIQRWNCRPLGGIFAVHCPLPADGKAGAHQAQQLLRRGQRSGLFRFRGLFRLLGQLFQPDGHKGPVDKAQLLRGSLSGLGRRLLRGVLDPLHFHRQLPQSGKRDGGNAVLIGGGGVRVVSGKGEGRLHSDRKGVVPLHPAVLCQPDQGEDRSVALRLFPHQRGVQGHLIDGAVRDHRAAGAV